jgi:PiT family inorganic phosphate transporter
MEYVFLALALGLALGFEFVNGFHDTANAVATVIYTHTLKPTYAVIWSGCWNLLGVLSSSGAVAFGIIALLPVELVINVGSGAGFAMVFSMLISAIMWNLGTWYLGLPASSSHTLIGSIMGVGLANSLMTPGHVFGEGVNWAKVQEVFTSLLVSPIVGFVLAGGLLLLAKFVITNPELYQAPEGDQPPPTWIRGLLMLTCTGVSFAHGSNDGQKGMGLIMLILVGILPGMFAVNMDTDSAAIAKLVSTSNAVVSVVQKSASPTSLNDQAISDELSSYLKPTGELTKTTLPAIAAKSQTIGAKLTGKDSFRKLSQPELGKLRTDMYLVAGSIGKLDKQHKFVDENQQKVLSDYKKQLETVTKFIPNWVKFAVALALGLGTMIGWKRIVVTVGEKIGKEHLTYAQGASAELVAMTTIGAADFLGLPVSTTHVLSSGIAGTMAANRSGLQKDTLISIATAWVLTLPACVLLGSATYAAGLFLVFNILGLK